MKSTVRVNCNNRWTSNGRKTDAFTKMNCNCTPKMVSAFAVKIRGVYLKRYTNGNNKGRCLTQTRTLLSGGGKWEYDL